ncbi:MAG: hypothetical protein KGJ13_00715 [Patescibacteria group bacterium]|nr:hypothetical protein [Patescibacteria group bacterium]
MEQKINQLAESQKKITESEEKIKKFVKKYGISEEQYSKFIESGDDEKLKDLIWGKLGFFTKLGWNATKRFDEELSSAVTVEDINLLLANRDTSLKEVGGSLRASLVGNETLNKALIANLKRESMEKPEADMSFGEFGKALKPEKEAVKKLYDQFKQENFADYQSQGLTEDDLRTDFVKGYANKVATKGKKGFWTSLFGKLFAPKIIEDFLK